jgi:hypothetical protein
LTLHEQFELEILSRMQSGRLLDALVFTGGTMLRLCHGLDRYSVDLDFWAARADGGDIPHKLGSIYRRNIKLWMGK